MLLQLFPVSVLVSVLLAHIAIVSYLNTLEHERRWRCVDLPRTRARLTTAAAAFGGFRLGSLQKPRLELAMHIRAPVGPGARGQLQGRGGGRARPQAKSGSGSPRFPRWIRALAMASWPADAAQLCGFTPDLHSTRHAQPIHAHSPRMHAQQTRFPGTKSHLQRSAYACHGPHRSVLCKSVSKNQLQ